MVKTSMSPWGPRHTIRIDFRIDAMGLYSRLPGSSSRRYAPPRLLPRGARPSPVRLYPCGRTGISERPVHHPATALSDCLFLPVRSDRSRPPAQVPLTLVPTAQRSHPPVRKVSIPAADQLPESLRVYFDHFTDIITQDQLSPIFPFGNYQYQGSNSLWHPPIQPGAPRVTIATANICSISSSRRWGVASSSFLILCARLTRR